MKKLVGEFTTIDFNAQKIELSDELSWVYEQAYTIKNVWREHYNYSLTDPRYLEADEATIYQDYLTFATKQLSAGGVFKVQKKTDLNYDVQTAEDLEKAIIKDCENIRMNRDNYVDEKFLKEYEEEKERLFKEYTAERNKGKQDNQIAAEMGDRFQRYADISKLKYAPKLDKPFENKIKPE